MIQVTYRVLVLALPLLVAGPFNGVATATTPVVEVADPCAARVAVTPVVAVSPVPTIEAEPPAIDADDAVMNALVIRQRNVVTILNAVVATGADDEFATFAAGELPRAKAHLDELERYAIESVIGRPAAMVAVLDQLRQEQDLQADQGGLDAYLPGSLLEGVCREGVDRTVVSQQALISNDSAIMEIAALGELVVDDDNALDLVRDLAAAANGRLAWFDSHLATPAPDRD